MVMDTKSQELFNSILKKEKRELKEYEVEFLRARKTYLNTQQLEKYQNLLTQTSPIRETVKQHGKSQKTH